MTDETQASQQALNEMGAVQTQSPVVDDIPDMTDAEREGTATGDMAWDFPDVGTMEEEKKKRVRLFSPNILFMKLRDVKMTLSKFPNKFTGEYDTNLVWEFDIIKNVDGTPIMLSSGAQAQKNEKTGTYTTVVFTNVKNVSQAKDGTPQDTRAMMTSLLGVESHASLKGVQPGMLVGKGIRVTVEVGKKQDGSPKQLWKSWAPWNMA